MNKLLERLRLLRLEFETELEASSRLRYACWAIVIILLIYIVLVMSDAAADWAAQREQIQQRFNKMKAVSTESYWVQRRNNEQLINKELLSRLRLADNESLARASLQVELEALAKDNHIKSPRINIGALETMGNYHVLKAELGGKIRSNSGLALLASLAEQNKLQTLDSLELTFSNNRRVRLLLSAYFKIEAKP